MDRDFDEFVKAAKKSAEVASARAAVWSQFEVGRYDSDFDVGAAIGEAAETMAVAYLEVYHSWFKRP